MPTDKKTSLDEIEQSIIEHDVCSELRGQAKQLVFGDGPADAEIVFIGEAPGKNEDQQGKPFVGAAGKFLNEMLEMIGLKRSDVYITNIVKYRPPNNRDPLPEEKKAFWPYLVRQLDVIRPKLVITLGRHSMEYFLPSQKISAIHGEPKRIRVHLSGKQGRGAGSPSRDSQVGGFAAEQNDTAWVILPLFHPAAALYNGGMRQTLIDDFMRIPHILKQLNQS